MTSYWFDPSNTCFWFTPDSHSTALDHVAAIKGMLKHPEYGPGVSRIWDLTEANLRDFRSSSSIKLQRMLEDYADQIRPSKVAVIVRDDFGCGIVRMHLGLSGADDQGVKIVYERQHAIDWISARQAA